MTSEEGNSGRKGRAGRGRGGGRLLVLFDQHAVHERIRLETLIKECYPNRSAVTSRELEQPLRFPLAADERRLLFHFPSVTAKFGLCVAPAGPDEVSATAVPECFLKREESDLKYHRPSSLRSHTAALAADIVAAVRETGAAAVVLPKTVMNVLCSRACRTAVKFGDALSPPKCGALLEQLSRCQAPYQCAHGRPAQAPIVDLDKLAVDLPPVEAYRFRAVEVKAAMVMAEDSDVIDTEEDEDSSTPAAATENNPSEREKSPLFRGIF